MGLKGYEGLDLSGTGAKVLTIRAPGQEAPPPAPAAIGPSPLVDFFVVGRPVPWSAPTVTRHGPAFKKRRLVDWQKKVKGTAEHAMRGREPHAGPVLLDVTFFLGRRPGGIADLCNLTKALEDALQGPVVVNDRQVCRHATTRVVSVQDGARVRVYAVVPPTESEGAKP